MISGASYGEVALLLVSAKQDEGIKDQTKDTYSCPECLA